MCSSSGSMMLLLPSVSSACRHTWGTPAHAPTTTHLPINTNARARVSDAHARMPPATAAGGGSILCTGGEAYTHDIDLKKGTTLALNKDKLLLESVDVSSHADAAKVCLSRAPWYDEA